MTIKYYTLEHAGVLPSIFESKSFFLRSFGGEIQVSSTDNGAEATFLRLKDTSSPVVTQEYSTDENVGFGTGTGNTNRYGPRREIKAVDISVPYEAPLSVHEGVDRVTVNTPDYEEIIAERIAAITSEWANHYDYAMGEALSESASKVIENSLDEDGVLETFNEARKTFVVNKVSRNVNWVAYVTSDVYNILVDSGLAKLGKGSTVNIDAGDVYMFKGFILEEMGESGESEALKNDIYFVADGVGVAGVAIEETRAAETIDYAGTVLVSVAKIGKYISENNKKGIVVANLETP